MDALGLDEVWWLVSPGNPLKADAKDMALVQRPLRLSAGRWRGVRASASATSSDGRARATPWTRCENCKRRYPEPPLHLADGRGHCGRISSVEHWRKLAESLPIAVIHRPGYDRKAHAARAMGWLRRFVRPSSQAKNWTDWSAPAILLLRLPPDPTSATGLRAHDPNWHERFADPEPGSKRFALPTSVRRALARPSH